MRIEYWQQVQQIDPDNLVFIDEMGVLLSKKRIYARSPHGSRVYDFKPFYRGVKVTVIGTTPLETSNGSDDAEWFNGCKRI